MATLQLASIMLRRPIVILGPCFEITPAVEGDGLAYDKPIGGEVKKCVINITWQMNDNVENCRG